MIKYNNTNNASTTLTAWISASSTTLIVENGDILPTAPFLLTLEHFDNEKVTVREIVKCIAKVGTILTIQRGAWTCVQDDTATPKAQNNTHHSFSVWDVASIYWTSEQVQDIQNEIEKKLNIDDFQAWTYVYGATSTETDAYSITIPWTLTSYSVGQVFRFMADTENTWNATLNVNGIWEKEILKNHDQHLQSGDIEAGQIVEVAYDGTNFQMDSQIASVISLDDISSLSYNDTTCYAWEEIHENDLIVTNGNSFNPDRADESTDVWGQTVNKYAIWFIGNGEVTNCFQIKTWIIEGATPDSVTVSIETDDNWKPSGTAVATADITDIIDNSLVSSTLRQIDWLTTSWSMTYTLYRLSCFAKHNYLDWFCTINKNNILNYTKVSQGFYPGYYNNDKEYDTYGYYDEQWESISFSSAPTCKCISADVIALYGNSDGSYKTHFFRLKWDKFVNIKAVSDAYCSYINWISNDWKIMTVWGTSSGTYANVKLYVCETPYDFENATIYNTGIAYSSSWTYYVHLIEDIDGEKYIMHSRWNTHNIYKINSDYTVTKINENAMSYTLWRFDCWISDWVVTLVSYTYTSSSEKTNFIRHKFTWNPYYWWTTKNVWIDSVVSWKEKLRLVIESTITWSVVDSIKVYDKEGEYYSECAVRDLNGWSNVSNKTPFIATNCVKARYARKVNKTDDWTLWWFANGDFTELNPVQYTFQGLKTWFSSLIADTLYYSDWYGWITTKKDLFQVWVSINPNSILMKPIQKEKTTWSEYFRNKTGSSQSIYRYMLADWEIKFSWVWNIRAYTNGWTATILVNSAASNTATYSFSKWDVVKIVYNRYEGSSSYTDATMTLSYTVY